MVIIRLGSARFPRDRSSYVLVGNRLGISALTIGQLEKARFSSTADARRLLRMKIYVGNLPWRFSDQELNDLFARVGEVQSARVITDRETGRSRGFGFVEMSQADGERAVTELNGTQVQNRALRVNEANERPPRSGGGGGSGGGGPRSGGYGGAGGGGGGGYGGGGGFGGGGGGYRGGDRSGDRGGDRGDRGDRDHGGGGRY